MGAFHAYDIRGIWGKDWNLEDAYKVGYFIPELLKTNKVLVGRDCRLSGKDTTPSSRALRMPAQT